MRPSFDPKPFLITMLIKMKNAFQESLFNFVVPIWDDGICVTIVSETLRGSLV